MRVLPDEAAIGKVFDYTVPADMPGAELVDIGTEVRIELHGRRIGGVVLAVDVDPPGDVSLRPIAKVRGLGPPQSVVDLALWAAWRWGGRAANVLRFARPPTAVRRLPVSTSTPGTVPIPTDPLADLAARALKAPAATHVLRTPPTADRFALLLAAIAHGGERGALIVVPSVAAAEALARRLRRAGARVALLPDDWALARAGGVTVIGARAAAFAPIAEPGVIVVVDEHDEALKDERTPTWHARDVSVERARRLGVPCLLTSATPTLEAVAAASGTVATLPRHDERAGWPPVQIVDRSVEEPGRQGLVTSALVDVLRHETRVLCILNRTGRARMLGCTSCGAVAECETCGAAVSQLTETRLLTCPHCLADRPVVCARCGGGRMKNLRMGTARAREELEALALRPVGEVVADTDHLPETAVLVGTEALLHRVDRASCVVFLDLDSELFAPRYRAQEHALVLIARASRIVAGRMSATGRAAHGRVYIQTRSPAHPVIQAAVLGDPARLSEHDAHIRAALRLPPMCAMAVISGEAAPLWAEPLRRMPGIETGAAADGTFLLRAQTIEAMADALAHIDSQRPPGRVRIEVDPLRV